MLTPEQVKLREQIDAELKVRAKDDFLQFLRVVKIPSATGPQYLRDCIADFQQETFEALAPTLHAVREGTMPPIRRFWIERTKKASKDGDLALCLLWLMAYSIRPVLVQVCAANQKQAGIIKRRVDDLLFQNPWLNDRVKVVQNKIRSTTVGEVVIEATDNAGSSQGDTPDLLILNELVHVAKWSVMETHANNADGVPQGVEIISTNAGFKGTPAHKWRLDAENDPDRWKMFVLTGKAPWADQANIDAAKRRNKGSEYARLWKGQWVSGKGDAVTEGAIARCFDNDLRQIVEPEPGWRYVGGLDLGVTHDHSGLVILGANEKLGKIKLAQMQNWAADTETVEGKLEVDLQEVEDQVRLMSNVFGVEWMGYDPSQAKLLAQRLGKRGVPVREMTFTASNRTMMADSFVQALENGVLECYDDAEGTLRRDFGKFDIVEKAAGMGLVATSDEFGHADVGTALVICLPKAIEILGGIGCILGPDDEIAWEDDGRELTEQEVEDMPEALKAIYNMEEPVHEKRRRKRSRR